jgi:hypothetical protein
MELKNIATNFNNQKVPGIKSIKKHPSLDTENFKSYGKLFLQKYFLNDGRKPNKMVAFGAKSESFSDPVVFIIYDLKLNPAIFFEFKDKFDMDGFIKFVGDFISKSKFKLPSKRVKENLDIIKEVDFDKIDKDMERNVFFAKLITVASGIITLASLAMVAWYYFKSIKYAAEEYYVNTKIESDLNKELFQGQAKNESGFEMFSKLENYLRLVLSKQINSLILCGPPGMSKTYMVRRTLYFENKKPGTDYKIEKGSALGINAIYQLLYDYRNKLLVLDDFDSPLQNEDVINLMKAVTDSYGKRIVSLSPEKKLSTDAQSRGDAPNKFEFTGQIIMITNKKKEDLDVALRSRSPVIEISFDAKQVVDAFEKLLKFVSPQVPYEVKLEVFNYIKFLFKNDPKLNVSFRSVKASIDARVGNPEDWKDMVKIIVEYKGKSLKENLVSKVLDKGYLKK